MEIPHSFLLKLKMSPLNSQIFIIYYVYESVSSLWRWFESLCYTMKVKAQTHTLKLHNCTDRLSHWWLCWDLLSEIRVGAPQTSGGFLTSCSEQNLTNAEENTSQTCRNECRNIWSAQRRSFVCLLCDWIRWPRVSRLPARWTKESPMNTHHLCAMTIILMLPENSIYTMFFKTHAQVYTPLEDSLSELHDVLAGLQRSPAPFVSLVLHKKQQVHWFSDEWLLKEHKTVLFLRPN